MVREPTSGAGDVKERSIVVTGGGRGVGRGIVEHLVGDRDVAVVVVERDEAATGWASSHPAADRIVCVHGDASDLATAEQAADVAGSLGGLSGWVNNAAVFDDVTLHEVPAGDVVARINANLIPAVVGCAVAVRRFVADGRGGAIVNVSSHQGARPVRGALAYATAKAAVEGLTRAVAVDYGPFHIRANAVALGSIVTERLEGDLASLAPAEAERFRADLRRLHPLGRPGLIGEVASTVDFLLSDAAAFVSGVVLPVDGGRSALGLDPEAR
jgi:NAD(P)-dependent dehydrogenase (short-subunit alcohol dehydrogenase family)